MSNKKVRPQLREFGLQKRPSNPLARPVSGRTVWLKKGMYNDYTGSYVGTLEDTADKGEEYQKKKRKADEKVPAVFKTVGK